MDIFYWSVGYIFISLLWIIPVALVVALLLNGLLVSISLLIWEIKILIKNDLPIPSIWKMTKTSFFRIFSNAFTDSSVTISGRAGKWNYLFKHTVWKVDKVTEEEVS